MSMSTLGNTTLKKKKKKVDVSVKINSASASTSPVSGTKKKGPSDLKAVKRLKKVKEKARAEQVEALEIISTLKERVANTNPKHIKTNEEDHLAEYLRMYRQLRRIIRKTERGCLESKTGQGAYQLATLYTQLRETIADIRSLTDLSDHADALIEKVLQPLFTTLTQNIANSMYAIKLKTKSSLKENKVRRTFDDIDTITLEAAKLMQDLYNKGCQDIKSILIGE